MNALNNFATIFVLESVTEYRKTWRTPGYVLPSLLFPMMFYFFFGILFSHQGANYDSSAYLLATYSVFGVMGPALFSFGAEIATEKDKGLLRMKQVSPMPVVIYFMSKAAVAVGFALIISLCLFAIGSIFGGVTLSLVQYSVMLLTLLVGVLPFCALGMCLGLSVKAQSAAAVVNLIYLPMAFLSGLWIPVNVLPDFLHPVTHAMPAYHFSQLLLKVQGFDVGQNLWLHIGVLVAYTLVFTLVAAKLFAKSATHRNGF